MTQVLRVGAVLTHRFGGPAETTWALLRMNMKSGFQNARTRIPAVPAKIVPPPGVVEIDVPIGNGRG